MSSNEKCKLIIPQGERMIGILEAICIFFMFLVGVLFPLGILIYMTVVYIKEEIEINKLIKRSK